jgi:hypothetical protein
MKAKFIFLAIILSVLVCVSCHDDSNPETAIIGKWEIVGQSIPDTERTIKTYKPSGYYTCFFSDGIVRYYSPEKIETGNRTYSIDNDFIYYNYEKTYEEGRHDYKYRITHNILEMEHHQGIVHGMYYRHLIIYKRKK